jgi:hypothetical protein
LNTATSPTSTTNFRTNCRLPPIFPREWRRQPVSGTLWDVRSYQRRRYKFGQSQYH